MQCKYCVDSCHTIVKREKLVFSTNAFFFLLNMFSLQIVQCMAMKSTDMGTLYLRVSQQTVVVCLSLLVSFFNMYSNEESTFFCTQSRVTQASLKLTQLKKTTLNFWSCFLPSWVLGYLPPHMALCGARDLNPGLWVCCASTLPTELYSQPFK